MADAGRPWRRIGGILFWLCLFPPVGLWMLYRDKTIAPGDKRRVLFYTFFIPTAAYLLFIVYMFKKTSALIGG